MPAATNLSLLSTLLQALLAHFVLPQPPERPIPKVLNDTPDEARDKYDRQVVTKRHMDQANAGGMPMVYPLDLSTMPHVSEYPSKRHSQELDL